MSTLLETLPPARPAELHAISIAKSIVGKNVLATTIGRGQAAITLAETRPEAKVSLWFHDKYQQQLLVKALQEIPTQLSLYCESDPPPSCVAALTAPCIICFCLMVSSMCCW